MLQHDFILLDRSGSMNENGKWAEAISGINTYVAKLATDKVDTGVTLCAFDKPAAVMEFEVLRDRITPSTWKPVSNDDAQPRGWTPLNDAIGRIVALARVGHNGAQYTRLALLIVTDGLENASRELDHAAAKKLLDECRAKGWQVIFLGADFDNTVQAASYGTVPSQFVASSAQNLGQTMAATATMRANYGLTGQSVNFSTAQKKKFAEGLTGGAWRDTSDPNT